MRATNPPWVQWIEFGCGALVSHNIRTTAVKNSNFNSRQRQHCGSCVQSKKQMTTHLAVLHMKNHDKLKCRAVNNAKPTFVRIAASSSLAALDDEPESDVASKKAAIA